MKTIVHEYCQRCGKKDAEVRVHGVAIGMHTCGNALPGPKQPPRILRKSGVIFIAGVPPTTPEGTT